MNKRETQIRVISAEPWDPNFWLIGRRWEDDKVYALVVAWEETQAGEGSNVNKSTMLTRVAAQILMDSLWSVGVRPTEGAGSAGAMAATQEHLNTVKEYLGRMTSLIEMDYEYLHKEE